MSQIEFIYNKAKLREFCLIETQGSIETDQPSGLRGQQRFAEIERREDGSVLMKIGIHRVPGSVVKLKKPLAVLKKQQPDSSEEEAQRGANGDAKYNIEAIIKEKFMFKTRPDVILQQEINALPTV
ncbi:Chromosome transmission fidelity protein 8 [Dipsacomyces acuminosporus]|nr:Chromosome transmission fidelity protein 8 [Dipsacomyces acuminosporus]